MRQSTVVSARAAWLVAAALVLMALAVFAGACTSKSTEQTSAGKSSDVPASADDRSANQPRPAGQPVAAQPASSGCVACHTSGDNIKNSAAPPPPVVKSAEQAGEG